MYKLDLYKTKYVVVARNDDKIIFSSCNRMQAIWQTQKYFTATII